jgi:predicted CoA-binding protein
MEEEARELLETVKTIAVVGLSANPERVSNSVARYMQEAGYRIIPVNPGIREALGEKAYASLRDIPEKVDLVNIFRRSEDVPPVVDEAIAIGAKGVWMQEGIINEEAADKARAAGLKVVMDSCIKVQHSRLPGKW